MPEFWESNFKDKQTMWGFEPAVSTIETVELFLKYGLNKVLIPGLGYGRNAKYFTDKGFSVTGIEISETAIELAKKYYGESINVFHGSVSDMPFDQVLYDGIFCYALIHLLNAEERAKLINACFSQLRPNGYMVFVALSKNTDSYGEGRKLNQDRYKTKHGVELFYYDSDSVNTEFCNFGLIDSKEISEPSNNMKNKPSRSQIFWLITCRKN